MNRLDSVFVQTLYNVYHVSCIMCRLNVYLFAVQILPPYRKITPTVFRWGMCIFSLRSSDSNMYVRSTVITTPHFALFANFIVFHNLNEKIKIHFSIAVQKKS